MVKRISRREFIKTCANTAATTFVLTACGNIFSMDAQAAKMKVDEILVNEENFITTVDDLGEKKAINFIYEGKKSILLYNDGNIKAFENICTHKKGPTRLRGKKLVCQWHGAWFNPETGKATKGPARIGSKLKEIKVKEIKGKLFIDA